MVLHFLQRKPKPYMICQEPLVLAELKEGDTYTTTEADVTCPVCKDILREYHHPDREFVRRMHEKRPSDVLERAIQNCPDPKCTYCELAREVLAARKVN